MCNFGFERKSPALHHSSVDGWWPVNRILAKGVRIGQRIPVAVCTNVLICQGELESDSEPCMISSAPTSSFVVVSCLWMFPKTMLPRSLYYVGGLAHYLLPSCRPSPCHSFGVLSAAGGRPAAKRGSLKKVAHPKNFGE
jgi:hypothetical protein